MRVVFVTIPILLIVGLSGCINAQDHVDHSIHETSTKVPTTINVDPSHPVDPSTHISNHTDPSTHGDPSNHTDPPTHVDPSHTDPSSPHLDPSKTTDSPNHGGHADPKSTTPGDHHTGKDNSGSPHGSGDPHVTQGSGPGDAHGVQDGGHGTVTDGHGNAGHGNTGHDNTGHGNTGHGDGDHGNDTHGNDTHGNHTGGHHGHHIERFKLAQMEFDRVSVPFILCSWIVFATIAKIVFHLNHKIPAIFPESCLLIVLGIVVGIVLYFTNTKGYELDSNTFFFYLLPPIILEAGYFMPIRAFFDNIGTILCFAVIGTLINTFLIGFSLFAFNENGLGAINVDLDILHCLVFGALISAVDPVAVLAVFDEVQVNEILHICVFGESLLNDAVTVVLYHMMEGFSHIGQENLVTQDILAGVGSFFIVGLGGTIVGILFAIMASLMTRFTKNAPVVEPLIVFTLGYMSYITAEIFHLSGIMACCFCGIGMKKYVEVNISRKSHTTIKYFMKMMASLCETIIFMFLGMSTVTDHHEWNTSFILFGLIFCIVYRAIAVIAQCLVLNTIRANKLNKVDQFIMAYGGLRGAIAFSLAVLLNGDVFPEKNMLITATLVVVYFTVFIQGTTIKPLVKVLRVKRASKHKPNMNEKLHDRLIDHTMAGIEDITGHFGHHEMRARFQKMDNLYIKPVLCRKNARKYRGTSILQVFNKLNEKEAQEYLAKKGSFVTGGIEDTMKSFGSMFHVMTRIKNNSETSLSSLVGGKQQSSKSIVVDNNASVLDMHALEAPESRKMKDDSKAHHILEDAMFKPRKRFHRHHRHMLPTDSNNDLYHHNIRKNLRHILSHSVHNHHNQSHRRGSRHGSHHKGLHEEDDKPRKNVSFANLSEAEVTAMGKKPEDKNKTNSVKKDEDATSHHSVESEGGITFTVSKVKEGDKTDFTLSKSADRPNAFSPSKKQQKHAPAPTLTETTLPWHNSASNEPVSMQSIVTIYNENEPCPSPGEAVWFNTVPLKEQESVGTPHTPLENMKFMKESPAVVMETYNTKEEEIPRYSSTPAATQQPSGEPDIVNCSMPTGSHENILPWNHKIDDVHEHNVSGGGSALPDLGVSAPSMSPVDVVDGQLSVITSEDCYLPATWRTSDEVAPAVSPLPRGAGYGDNPDGDSQQTDLPLPWRNNDQGDHTPGSESDTDSAPKSNVVFELGPPSESASARSLPWENPTPDEVVLDIEEDGGDGMVTSDVDQSSMRCLSTDSAPDPDDCLPPPWRSVNVSEASIPVRSPSASHELDSLVPQASHNSLRLSEAESRHSEQFRGHHHVIDIAPRELEHSSSGNALSAMVGDESEPLDLVSRVQRWLLDTKLDQQDPVPEDLYDTALQDSCAAAVFAAADLSDTGECEDTYL